MTPLSGPLFYSVHFQTHTDQIVMYRLNLSPLVHLLPSRPVERRGERIGPVDSVPAQLSCGSVRRCLQKLRLPGHHNGHLQLLAVRAVRRLLGKDLLEHVGKGQTRRTSVRFTPNVSARSALVSRKV